MRKNNYVLMLAAALIAATPAAARDVTVQVDAASGPWRVDLNSDLMPYGIGDAKPPVVVPFDIGGGVIAIIPSGTTAIPGRADVPPIGLENDAVDDKEVKKKRYPSFYAPKLLYPSYRHALVAAFVDDKGVVVGRPFIVGKGIRVPIPENTAGLALGFNDISFKGNTGALSVIVVIPD
ncbi:hypothetical protein JW805_01190 [Roseomonas aeriglobus]|nr:hypothetical protein [Roseomonas aeriglobus]